jgi:GNAT superfamily N-acetyltransferase
MPNVEQLRFRSAGAADVIAIATLHADSWRRHYRDAYSDSFLDGDVVTDRETVWAERLHTADSGSHTVLAEDDVGVVGFAHVVFDSDPTWGALLDNLHVAPLHKRRGVGSELLALIALGVSKRETPLYLWVLEQNLQARAFYQARGAVHVEQARVSAPGGVANRLNGTPSKLRYFWADPSVLLAHRFPDREASVGRGVVPCNSGVGDAGPEPATSASSIRTGNET